MIELNILKQTSINEHILILLILILIFSCVTFVTGSCSYCWVPLATTRRTTRSDAR